MKLRRMRGPPPLPLSPQGQSPAVSGPARKQCADNSCSLCRVCGWASHFHSQRVLLLLPGEHTSSKKKMKGMQAEDLLYIDRRNHPEALSCKSKPPFWDQLMRS
eukprot:760613-Hanusia_phi.AAC.2